MPELFGVTMLLLIAACIIAGILAAVMRRNERGLEPEQEALEPEDLLEAFQWPDR